MVIRIHKWLNKSYPRNFILKNPYIGTLIFVAYCFCFLTIYEPLKVHEARSFSLAVTMALYCCVMAIPVIGIIKILNRFRYFSTDSEWTLLKELLSIVIILLGIGITIYFAGFFIETPSPRWNLSTFLNSCLMASLIGIVPFMFFTLINYRFLFTTDIVQDFKQDANVIPEQIEELVRIASRLKKEELSIYPSQLIYAESDGNYVVFHLNVNNQIRKEIIRNSISNIEQELSAIPFLMRTHRAFIVNVRQVISLKGNTLGYRLKLNGTDTLIPVSRQKTRDFDQLLKGYQ